MPAPVPFLESPLHAVLAQLVEHLPSKQVVASSSLVYRSMHVGVCNFSQTNLVIKALGVDAYDDALCKGL